MLRVVLHHTYRNGRAADVSGHGNHGVPIATTAGSGAFASALHFAGGASEVRVSPSPTLSELNAIRAVVRFRLDAPGLGQRQNLMEGHLAFALYLHPKAELKGTILDASGAWRGATSAAYLIGPDEWHTAEVRHDGYSTLEILLDGTVVGAAYDVQGPVRSVGPHGVSLGHWPERDPRYTLRGWIDDAKLARHELDPEDLVDPCCADLRTIDDLLAKARADGMTPERARELLGRIRALEAEMRTAAIAGDRGRSRTLGQIAAQGGAAVEANDTRGTIAAVARTWDFLRERMSEGDMVDFGRRALDLVSEGPSGRVLRELLRTRDPSVLGKADHLLRAFCFPHSGVGEGAGRAPGPRDDPSTDRPDGSRPSFVDQLPRNGGKDGKDKKGKKDKKEETVRKGKENGKDKKGGKGTGVERVGSRIPDRSDHEESRRMPRSKRKGEG
jgi:hypothetical protein